MFVWIFGLSASGKTTLAQGLGNLIQCDTINVGKVLRSRYSPKRILNFDISESEIFSIVSTQISESKTNLILIDNFPINKQQLQIWEGCYSAPAIVFVLEISDTKERSAKRGRIDDTDIIHTRRRLQFENDVIPIIQYMELQTQVVRLNAEKPPKELIQDAFKSIRESFTNQGKNFCDHSILKIERHSELAKTPTKAYPFSGGHDLYLTKSIIICAHKTLVHSTELSVEIRGRTIGVIYNRSSTATRGIHIHSGIIDVAYSQPLKLIITNLTDDTVFIDNQDPVAQILIFPLFYPKVSEENIIKSDRGGLGSSNG